VSPAIGIVQTHLASVMRCHKSTATAFPATKRLRWRFDAIVVATLGLIMYPQPYNDTVQVSTNIFHPVGARLSKRRTSGHTVYIVLLLHTLDYVRPEHRGNLLGMLNTFLEVGV